MLAALIMPMIGMLGLIFDIGQTRLVRERLVDSLRVAALSGVQQFDAGNRDDLVLAALNLNFPNGEQPMYGATRPQPTGTTPALGELTAPISSWNSNPLIHAETDGTINRLRLVAAVTVPTLLLRAFQPDTAYVIVTGKAKAERRGPGPGYSYALID